MTQQALRKILLESQHNWSRGSVDDTRVPQKSLDRYLQDLAEAAVPPRQRPGRHKGRRARVVGLPYAMHV